MSMEIFPEKIVLKKGFFISRVHTLPLSSVVRVTIKRSPILRLFRVKQTEFFTKKGSFKLFLRRDEPLSFLPEDHYPKHYIKPRFIETAFGAFIDVRALGGIALFALTIRRLGTVFGGMYLDRVLEALDTAAENVEQALSSLRVYIPKVAAAVGVFALAAWVFAYLRRLASLSRFCVGRIKKDSGSLIVVKSGLLTLYEHMLVPNSDAAIMICDSPVSLLAKHAPVYHRGVMVYPAADRSSAHKLVHILSGERLGKTEMISPPKSAWFSYCAVPFWWSIGFAIALVIVYVFGKDRPTALLKTALYCGIFICVYAVLVYLYYMRYSGVKSNDHIMRVSFRRSMRLYTAFIFSDKTAANLLPNTVTITENIFQRRSGLCNFLLSTAEPRKIKARLLDLKAINKLSQRTLF